MISFRDDVDNYEREVLPEVKDKEVIRKFRMFKLISRVLPQYYEATTLHDLIENKDKIVPTYSILPTHLLFLGEALIDITSPVQFNFSGDRGIISDMNDSLEVRLGHIMTIRKRESRLVDNMVLYDSILIYKPKTDDIWLSYFSGNGPESYDRRSLFLVPRFSTGR